MRWPKESTQTLLGSEEESMCRSLSLCTLALSLVLAFSGEAALAKPPVKKGISFKPALPKIAPKIVNGNHPPVFKKVPGNPVLAQPKIFKKIAGHHFKPFDKLVINKGVIQPLKQTVVVKDYHFKCGTKCSFGYCYKNYTHCHWAHKCWLPACGCYGYYCPYTLVYYYWCEPDLCWYPITYCPYGCYVF
jgi:hypothetical protein